MKVFWALTWLLTKRFFRQPAVLFWSLAFPIALSVVLGMAFSRPPAPVRIGIMAPPPFQSPDIEWVPTTPDQLSKHRVGGHFHVWVSQVTPSMQVGGDPSHGDTRLARLLLAQQASATPLPSVTVQSRPGGRYIDFLVPGMMALGIMNSSLWGIGYALIDMRNKKMLRRLVATPMPPATLLLAHFMVRLVVGVIESLLLLAITGWLFHLVVQGSIVALCMCFVSGTFAFSGFGVMIGSRTDSSVVGNGLINAVSLPMTICSGVFFTYRSFPNVVANVIEWLPLTVLADALRLGMTEPVGPGDVWVPCMILLAVGLVGHGLGLRWFKWH